MTLFLEDRGWLIDLVALPADRETEPHAGELGQKLSGVALRMTFEGDARVPDIVGETTMPGHHNYFLGNDENRWRANVPLYGSVRYRGLYPGIDLRLREMNGVPEYVFSMSSINESVTATSDSGAPVPWIVADSWKTPSV